MRQTRPALRAGRATARSSPLLVAIDAAGPAGSGPTGGAVALAAAAPARAMVDTTRTLRRWIETMRGELPFLVAVTRCSVRRRSRLSRQGSQIVWVNVGGVSSSYVRRWRIALSVSTHASAIRTRSHHAHAVRRDRGDGNTLSSSAELPRDGDAFESARMPAVSLVGRSARRTSHSRQ